MLTKLLLILPTGLLAVSIASILIRWCEAPALTIATYRLCIASILLYLMGGRKARHAFTRLGRRDLQWGIISGFFLALHFAAWIRSLELTSVASSVVLVSTAPFFVVLGARVFLHSRVAGLLALGLTVAFAGLVLIAHSDFSARGENMAGDLLAILGAVGGAGYMLCGRYLRARLDTYTYIFIAYSIAAVLLLLAAALSSTPLTGFSGTTYGLFVLIALVPQLVGHSSFNWSLKYLSAPLVSTILLGEPILASFLAVIFLHEIPTAWQMAGSLLVILGVGFAIWSEK